MTNKFAELPEEYSNYEKSKVVITPIPFAGTVTYKKGTEKGPQAILDASFDLELYDEENKDPYEAGIHTISSLELPEDPEKAQNIIYENAKRLFQDNKFPISLGGEHSITSALVKACKEKHNNLSVLQLDAHADLKDSFEGQKFSHTCVMKRIVDLDVKTVQVGIRSLDVDDLEVIKDKNIPIFYAKDIYNNDDWMDKAIEQLSENVYITFDVDFLDPSIMPSTGTPEPGGLLWYQTLKFLKKVFKNKNVVGFDLVELSPIENLHHPDFLCAKLVYKMIGYKFSK